MPGGGTKLATTPNKPTARLVDITRLIRRAGRVLTGVDRVEKAYIEHLAGEPIPCFALVRSPMGYLLLDAQRALGVIQRAHGSGKQPDPDLLSRLPRGQTGPQRSAFTDARQSAIARCLPAGLSRMLQRHLPQGSAYLNVGHSNLTARVFRAAQGLGGPISVLVHDIIPLERPEDQRPGTVAPFEGKLRRVLAHADQIICNSQDTQSRLDAWATAQGLRMPRMIVSHLGTTLAAPKPDELPPDLPPKQPFVLTVGTIEPRKNHAFLLDLWADMGPDAPLLLIVGGRGWRNEAVFKRLDALPADGNIREISGLSDGALAALMQNARAMLFPSLAEGFGWPPIEASALGLPVLANDLAIYREILGDIPIYASVSDRYLWTQKIKMLAETAATDRPIARFDPPGWDAHFKIVLSLT